MFADSSRQSMHQFAPKISRMSFFSVAAWAVAARIAACASADSS